MFYLPDEESEAGFNLAIIDFVISFVEMASHRLEVCC